MKAIIRTSRITPKKANLVAGLIRNQKADAGLEILKYTPKKAAKILYKLLNSAVNNAVNNFKQDQKTLIVKEVIVTKGPTLKRGVPVSRGRVYPILKRTANITLILGIDTEAAKPEKSAKATKENAEKGAKKPASKAKKTASTKKSS